MFDVDDVGSVFRIYCIVMTIDHQADMARRSFVSGGSFRLRTHTSRASVRRREGVELRELSVRQADAANAHFRGDLRWTA